MNSKGSLARAALVLGLSDQQIARKLGLSLAVLRFVDRPTSPPYLQLALAALVADIDLNTALECPPSAPSSHGRQFAASALQKN